jgi:hypothetical protein
MTHSLQSAIADGTITEEDAYYGLALHDLIRLEEKHGDAAVLVYLRKGSIHECDAIHECEMMTVNEIIDWHDAPVPKRCRGVWWYFEDILTVTPLVFEK